MLKICFEDITTFSKLKYNKTGFCCDFKHQNAICYSESNFVKQLLLLFLLPTLISDITSRNYPIGLT